MAAYRGADSFRAPTDQVYGPSRLPPHIHCGESSGLSVSCRHALEELFISKYIDIPGPQERPLFPRRVRQWSQHISLRRSNNCLSREDFAMPISSFGNVIGFLPLQ